MKTAKPQTANTKESKTRFFVVELQPQETQVLQRQKGHETALVPGQLLSFARCDLAARMWARLDPFQGCRVWGSAAKVVQA